MSGFDENPFGEPGFADPFSVSENWSGSQKEKKFTFFLHSMMIQLVEEI